MEIQNNRLIVKCVPHKLTDEYINEFFKKFNITGINIMNGAMRGTVFLDFKDNIDSTDALLKLNQYKLFNKTLKVEYVKGSSQNKVSSTTSTAIAHSNTTNPPLIIHNQQPQISVTPNSKFPPTQQTIDFINSRLQTDYEFFSKVLSLMTCTNTTASPPPITINNDKKRKSENLNQEETQDISTKSISQLDIDRINQLFPNAIPLKQLKKFKVDSNVDNDDNDISDNNNNNNNEIKTVLHIVKPVQKSTTIESNHKFNILSNLSLPTPNMVTLDRIQSEITNSEALVDNQVEKPIKIITIDEILSNRSTIEELLGLVKKASLEIGDPTCKLYIKNLSKSISKQHFYSLFRRLFQSDDDIIENLRVDYFRKGKLRNQAFITFPSIELAQKALEESQGYHLADNTPIIIQYGKLDK
ncbi:hypothetical protein DLAC_04527 [Tieghemostelium lacteum]|uniref:RRM domain-containing protein n=1 Tax=Tieghemostelium lacteum TaxID=361077 RepID=A0A151ZJS9_TIELA|nr:hypothetical protein DLAC_04527 [Tieghemostelium lacteum]|eukprot:KYQ94233.1 hypothetical protein DLAC_04527 [Tieghemostelium lacteum]